MPLPLPEELRALAAGHKSEAAPGCACCGAGGIIGPACRINDGEVGTCFLGGAERALQVRHGRRCYDGRLVAANVFPVTGAYLGIGRPPDPPGASDAARPTARGNRPAGRAGGDLRAGVAAEPWRLSPKATGPASWNGDVAEARNPGFRTCPAQPGRSRPGSGPSSP